jgi:hypothetical protein
VARALRQAYPCGMDAPRMEGQGARQVFRPSRLLAAVMAVAALLWSGVFVYLLRFDGVPWRTFASAGFFIVLFGGSLAYHVRTRIVVDARGITCRGVVRTQRFDFADIRKVDVLPGPVTVYAVRGRGRFVHFTSFFAHHRHLAALVVERAGLTPVMP